MRHFLVITGFVLVAAPIFLFGCESTDSNTDGIADKNTDEIPDTNTDEIPDTNTDEIPNTNTDEIPDENDNDFPFNDDLPDWRHAKLRIEKETTITINDSFFGVNALTWLETDEKRFRGTNGSKVDSYEDAIYTQNLRAMNVKSFRFPGGGVANNYNWKTHRVFFNKVFPYRPSDDEEGEQTMDYLEFINWAKTINPNAQINFVVNLDGILMKSLDNGYYNCTASKLNDFISLASEWVQEVNIKRGYNIKYWEIGNESYHTGTRCNLKAEEYAAFLVTFSKAMKSVDPSIQIGAVGPFGTSEFSLVDRLTGDAINYFRGLKRIGEKNGVDEMEALRDELKNDSNFIKHLNEEFPGGASPTNVNWWNVVTEKARGHFDFIVTHRYDNRRITTDSNGTTVDMTGELHFDQSIEEIRNLAQSKTGKNIKIFLTEWNVGSTALKDVEAIDYSLMQGDMIMDYIKGGVDYGNIWPTQLKGHSYPLMDFDTLEIKPAGKSYAVFGKHIRTKLNPATSDNDRLKTLVSSSADEKSYTIHFLNKVVASINTHIYLPAKIEDDLNSVKLTSLVSNDNNDVKEEVSGIEYLGAYKGKFVYKIIAPGKSISMIKFVID